MSRCCWRATADGIGRAFHNVCPYDGCEAVLSPLSDIDEIVTPYHGWRYALDGRLLQAPYWDGTPDAARLDVADLNADLEPIDCAEWLGTVFLRLTAEGDSFDRYMQPVTDYCADLDLQRLAPGHDEHGQPRIDRLTIRANWKTVYENYAPNVYHEGFVHAQYRRSPHTHHASRTATRPIAKSLAKMGSSGSTTTTASAAPSIPIPRFDQFRTAQASRPGAMQSSTCIRTGR